MEEQEEQERTEEEVKEEVVEEVEDIVPIDDSGFTIVDTVLEKLCPVQVLTIITIPWHPIRGQWQYSIIYSQCLWKPTKGSVLYSTSDGPSKYANN